MNDNRRYPGSDFTAEYPYNQSTITRSGHEFHVNDTPGSESLRIGHRKGTFAEINSAGKLTVNVVGKASYYLQDSLTETVDGHRDMKISGSLNVNADNSINMQTAGDWTEGCGGSRISGVAGSYHLTTAFDKSESIGWDRTTKVQMNDLESVGLAKVTTSTKRSDVVATVHTMSSGVSTEIMTGGILRLAGAQIILDADSILIMTRTGPITLNSALGIAAAAGADVSVTSGAATTLVSGAATTVTAAGLATIGAAQVDINGAPVRINGIVQTGN